MTRKLIAILVLALLAPVVGAEKPNVVLIFADDLGYGDAGCYGATKLKTPNIDRLAREGRRFTDAHSSSAVCSPSRYGLLTGKYPLRKNFWGPLPLRQGLTIDSNEVTLASLLKGAGYQTACIGKWHLGFGDKQPDWNGELKPGPLEVGFDSYFGIPSVNSGPPFVYVEDHHVVGADESDPFVYGKKSVTKVFPEKSGYGAIGGGTAAHRLYDDELVGTTIRKRAMDWIDQRDTDTPFFLYLATTNIHHPFTPAKQFVGTSDCGPYGDFVHELDWIVGGVLDSLEERGFADNTLVLFTSDNGGMLHVTGQKAWKLGHRLNGDLLGFKFGVWEGGHRVPMIARWPGKIPAGTTCDALISHIDLLATLASLVDQPLPKEHELDSVNQLANFTHRTTTALRDTLVLTPNSPKHLGIRRGPWVYVPAQNSGGFQGKKVGDHLFAGAATMPFTGRTHSDIVGGRLKRDAPTGQLYNLESDPTQQQNVYASHPEVVKKLDRVLQRYQQMIPTTKRLGWINLKQ